MIYHKGLPVEETRDDNGDGIIDAKIWFDVKGSPQKSTHDLDQDGKMEVTRRYKKGNLVCQEEDKNLDGVADTVLKVRNGHAVSREKDTNLDGRMDQLTTFTKGTPSSRIRDMNFDGKNDFFCKFDAKGRPLEIKQDRKFSGTIDSISRFKNGVMQQVTWDANQDGHFETTSHYKKGKMHIQTMDTNKDNHPDIKIFLMQKKKKSVWKLIPTTMDTQTPGSITPMDHSSAWKPTKVAMER